MEGSVSETRCVPGGLHPPPPPPPHFASISAMKLIRILPQEPLHKLYNIRFMYGPNFTRSRTPFQVSDNKFTH